MKYILLIGLITISQFSMAGDTHYQQLLERYFELKALSAQLDNTQLIQGPQGEQGEQGIQGEDGPQGLPGGASLTESEISQNLAVLNSIYASLESGEIWLKEMEASFSILINRSHQLNELHDRLQAEITDLEAQ